MVSLVDETISSRSFRVRQLFRDLIGRLKPGKATSVDGEAVKEDYAGKVVDAFDRFNLWAGNVGALLAPTSRLSLDQRLADAPETRVEICQELKELAEAVEDLTEAIHRQCLANNLDDKAVLIPVEDDPNEDRKSERELGKELGEEAGKEPGEEPDEKPFDEVCSLLDVISVYLEFLFRLAMLVRKAGPRDRFKHALEASGTTFPDDFDINYLREKHPKLRQPEFGLILKRLGGANAKRRQFIKYCRDHKTRLSAEPRQETVATEERVAPAPTELLSSKATTFVPQALAAAAAALQASGAVDDEPEEDMASQFSASTTTNALSALKLPSLGDLSPDGKSIECPICHTIQTFRHDQAWRAHAFRDLKAYVCIAGLDCNEMFGDRNTWFEHELHRHRARHICNLCIGGERLSSVSEMQDHFRSCHGQFSEAQAQMLIESGREPVTEFKASDCPFCDEWADRLGAKLDPKGKGMAGKAPGGDATVTASRFKRHVAAHQEQLAIFAMPRAVGDDGDDDKDGDGDTVSSRVAAPTTVLDFVEAEGIEESLDTLPAEERRTSQDGAQVVETDASAKVTLGTSQRISQKSTHNEASIQINQAARLAENYRHTGRLGELNEAIRIMEQHAIDMAEPYITPTRLSSLGVMLGMRFERTGSMDDLNRAVDAATEAMDATPQGHPDRAGCLNNLGNVLGMRFERTGSMDDLDRAINVMAMAVKVTPHNHLNRAGLLSNFGRMLGMRFKRTGSLDDLNRAVDAATEAMDATPQNHPDRAVRLNSLGNLLGMRFERTGSMDDLDHAIDVATEAVDATPQHRPDRAGWLSNLGSMLSTRFERTGSMDDLNRAVGVFCMAVDAIPRGYPDRASWLSNFGSMLARRFKCTGSMDDLNRAVDIATKAVNATPQSHPDHAIRLNGLGTLLGMRSKRTGSMNDLDHAIDVTTKAVDATHQGHSGYADYLGNLSVMLGTRFERTGSMGDLNRAVDIATKAVNATPQDHPDRAVRLSRLENLLGMQIKL